MMNKKEYAPIAVFTYARLDHTKKMMDSLLANEECSESELFVFSDGAKDFSKQEDVMRVRKYLHTIEGFKSITIIEREKNLGLSNNLIDGISEVLKKKGSIIVIEDDLVLSKYFLKFMNEALVLYRDVEEVSAISGFVNPVKRTLPETFFLRYFACWGWATWERSWSLFEFDARQLRERLLKKEMVREFNIDYSMQFLGMLESQIFGRINSWAIRFYASSLVNEKYILFPGKSLTKQIGIDGSGTHSGKGNDYDVTLAVSPIIIKKTNPNVNKMAYTAFRDFYLQIGGLKSYINRYLYILKIRKVQL